jgi:catechol 2,3-dioxygenase-like lactoylglutathione lyase family enzyme
MIRILGIDHVVLRTTNLEAMLGFYRDILNCPVERTLSDLGLVQLRAGNSLIDIVPVDSELGKAGGGPPRQDGRNMEHLCLLVAPAEEPALASYLQDRGIDCGEFAERYGADGYGRSVYLNDPEGNVVELKLGNSEPTTS